MIVFRLIAAALGAILLFPSTAVLTTAGLLVTVGDVTSTSAVVWTRSVAPGEVGVEYGPIGGDRARTRLEARTSDDLTGKVRIERLLPATRYGYRVRARGGSATGEFVTAPAADADGPARFAWSGDLGGQGYCRPRETGYPIFDVMTGFRPDFFVFLGDTIYADSRCDRPGDVPGSDFIATRLEGFRAKHRYNRADPAVQRFFRTTSVYAI